MKGVGFWKYTIPPVVVPLALSLFVALAGPGGVAEVGDEGGTEPAAVEVQQSDDGEGTVQDEAGDASAHGVDSGCEEALTEVAQARNQLEEHAADGGKPAGGVAGNQNALDKQCHGAFAEASTSDATPTTDAGTDPGKSEQARGGATAGGQAHGQGQTKADASGNGPAKAPGQNKP